jgi:signal transduction histidine kinase
VQFVGALIIASLLAGVALPARAAEATRNVLLLYSATRLLPAPIEADRGLRRVLENAAGRRIEVYAEYLDVPRFNGDAYVHTIATYLREKYSAHPPDVIVVEGTVALEFLTDNRTLLFPFTPVVHMGVTASALSLLSPLPADVIGVPVELDVVGTLNLAFRLRPGASRLVLVTGASERDRRFAAALRNEVARLPPGVKGEFLAGLPTETLRKRLAELSDNAVVFTGGYFEDGDGRVFTPRDSVQAIAAAANAPVFAPYSTYMGTGVVGGYMTDYLVLGQQAGQVVNALLDGTAPASVHLPAMAPTALTLDWRQVRRWGLDANAIPADAIVHFREPTLLDAHRNEVIIAVIVFLLQAGLIITLLFERRRRLIAETEVQARFSEMSHMNRRVVMEGLAASIAHELNQPLGAIYNNAGAAQILLNANPPKLNDVTEILDDIKQDDMRASEIISRIRKMLRKADVAIEDLDLNEAIVETIKLLTFDALANGVSLKTDLEPSLPRVRADRVQVQQVLLNLALNAIEAMRDQPGANRQLVIQSRRADAKDAEVSVADSGPGIPPEMQPLVFDPFVTSKAGGMGLGLSISRTIIEAHGGGIRAEALAVGGAAIRFTLPFAAPSQS